MSNFEKIKSMNLEELAAFLYVKISRKGLKKTEEWLQEESEEDNNENRSEYKKV